jgi:voltage-gated potassium channel
MILGYGIIAVPTGIVTAEIAKELMIKSLSIKPCTECGTEDYPDNANFCPSRTSFDTINL